MDRITSALQLELRKWFKDELKTQFQQQRSPKTFIKSIMKKILKDGCLINMNLLIKTKILQLRERLTESLSEQSQNSIIKRQIYEYLGNIVSKQYLRYKEKPEVIEIHSSHDEIQSSQKNKLNVLTEEEEKVQPFLTHSQQVSASQHLSNNNAQTQNLDNISKNENPDKSPIKKQKQNKMQKTQRDSEIFGHLIFGDEIKDILDIIVLPNMNEDEYPVLIEWQQRKDHTTPKPSVLFLRDIKYYLPQLAQTLQLKRGKANRKAQTNSEPDKQKKKKRKHKHKHKTIYK